MLRANVKILSSRYVVACPTLGPMRRALLIALVCAACGPKFPESITRPGGDHSSDMICNDENVSPRGTAGLRCRSRRQVEEDNRYTKDLENDPRQRQSYN